MDIPTRAEVEHGCEVFCQHERRDAMYKTAIFLVGLHWGRPADTADSLGVLLLTWNNAFYRYGSFDFGKLEECIAKNFLTLEAYRKRKILDYTPGDDVCIKALFNNFLVALAIVDGNASGRQSPVAVVKALHLLAPSFFPLWDMAIAKAYGCNYSAEPAERYLCFLKITRDMCRQLGAITPPAGKTLLKLIDEYNYAKFTKRWI